MQTGNGGWVYIMTSKTQTVLYTGVTSDLMRRMHQHVTDFYPKSFTSKYQAKKLVWYKFFETIEEAIKEEKRIKGGNRQQKIRLIEEINPQWNNLFELEVSKW